MANLRGKLSVTIAEAQFLTLAHNAALCTFYVSAKKQSTQSAKYNSDKGPIWNESASFNLEGKESFLDLEVLHPGVLSSTLLGKCRVPLKDLTSNTDAWYRIGTPEHNQYAGEVRIKANFESADVKPEAKIVEPPPPPPVPENKLGAATSAVKIPGTGATHVKAGSYYCLMALNSETGNYFLWNTRTGRWEQQPGSAASISAGADSDMWITSPQRTIYRFDPHALQWRHIPGTASKVSSGGLNHVAILHEGKIFLWCGPDLHAEPSPASRDREEKSLWTPFSEAPHNHAPVDLAIAHDGTLWAVHADKSLWHTKVGQLEWTRVDGDATQIGVGNVKLVVACNKDSGHFFKLNPAMKEWVPFKVCSAHSVDVAADGTYIASNSEEIWFGKC